jgi:hypothetical protein
VLWATGLAGDLVKAAQQQATLCMAAIKLWESEMSRLPTLPTKLTRTIESVVDWFVVDCGGCMGKTGSLCMCCMQQATDCQKMHDALTGACYMMMELRVSA